MHQAWLIEIVMDGEWRPVLGQSLTCPIPLRCRQGDDVGFLKSTGRWVLDPVDGADEWQFGKLVEYFVWYYTKDEDQMVRVKPTAKAYTLPRSLAMAVS
jgi:hypothetical protein